MTKSRSFTRREFLAGTGLLLAGAALRLDAGILPAPAAEPIIDIHQHTGYHGLTTDQLVAHQRAMGITTTILLPAGHPVSYGSTHYGVSNGLQAKAKANEACYEVSCQYPGEFLFGANEVPDVPGAVAEIEKYLKLGAPIIGELKFNVECDSPEMQRIYELAQAYRVPVLMHWQYNMYNRGFDRFHKMLAKYPEVNFIGHCQTWWANIDKHHLNQNVLYPKGKVTPGGLTDRYLQDYPNMYGDLSAGSGLNAFTRDEEHSREFFRRHQDKLLYGSDCADTAGQGAACQGAQTIAAVRRLAASKLIERKLLYDNAKKLFRLQI